MSGGLIVLFRPIEVDQFFVVDEHIKFRFRHNAHIPGASFIEFIINEKTIVFSGDIGRPKDPMLLPPEMPTMQVVTMHR